MDLKKEIAVNQGILIVLPNRRYNAIMLKIAKKVEKKKVCYLTTSKAYDAILESFQKEKINPENFIFIDCITKTITEPKPAKNCLFVSSPQALTEMSLSINKCIQSSIPVILIDSLSTLSVYNSDNVLIRFVYDLINKVKASGAVVLVLSAADKDKNSSWYKKIEMMVDKVIEVKK